MSTAESRRVAIEWTNALVELRYNDVKSLAAPNTTWWLNGLASKVRLAGPGSYISRVDSIAAFHQSCKSLDIDIKDVVAEGNKVIVEIESTGTSPAHDKVYKNHSMVKMVVEGGKVVEVREYVDFLAFFDFLGMDPQ